MDPGLLGTLGALLGEGAPSHSIAILTVPGRGIVGTAITPNGQDGAFPLPMGLLQQLGGQVSRVPVAQEEDAAATLGGIMSMMMEHMTRVVVQRSLEETAPKVPPASERVRDALPRVVVTKEDLLDSTNSKCSVCLEDFQPGCRSTRMLCGHLFCTSCIREWLREANSCPVCRYELATDSEEFEPGRRSRMSGRTVRLKRAELRLMRASELRRLMEALGVSSEGCLEKAELLGRLEQAADVVLEEDLEKVYEAEELRDLPLPLLRNLLERHRVIWNVEEELSEEEERVKVMQSLAESGWMGEAAREAMKKEEEKERPNEKPSEKKDEKLKSEEKENEKGNVQSEVDSEKQAEEKPLESPEDAEQTVKKEADGSGHQVRPTRPAGPAPANRRPRSRTAEAGAQ